MSYESRIFVVERSEIEKRDGTSYVICGENCRCQNVFNVQWLQRLI